VQAPSGWFSVNCLENSLQPWKASEWRTDSRVELIFESPQDVNSLKKGLQDCLIHPL